MSNKFSDDEKAELRCLTAALTFAVDVAIKYNCPGSDEFAELAKFAFESHKRHLSRRKPTQN